MSAQNLDAERAVLGALLLEPERIPEASDLALDDLADARSRLLLRELRAMYARGEPIDFVTVGACLNARGLLKAAGGANYLADLAQSVTTTANLQAHIRIVREAAHQRRVKSAAARLAQADDAFEREQAEREVEHLLGSPLKPDREGDKPLRWRPFPTHALPPALARYATESAAAIGCDESLVALPLLAAAAAAIGTTRRVRLKVEWTEPSVLWAAPVADSGSAKSPAIDAALRFTHAANADAMAEHAEALRAYESATLAFERDLATWKQAKQSGPPPERPLEPRPRRVLASDATLESVGALLAYNPGGLLLARDELAGWFGSHGRYSGARVADASGWLELHGARPLTIDRKAAGPLYVARAACSITGTIQPATLRQQATPEALASGLFARFLLAWPPARPRVWTETTVAPATISAAARVFDALFALDALDGAPIDLPLTLEARAAWVEFFEAHAKRTASVGAHLAAAFSKLEGAAARLALVHALAVDSETDAVDAASMRAGVMLATWFSDEAERFYAMLLDAPREDVATFELVDLIRRRGGGITPAELARTSRHYRPVPRARDALARLHRMGLGKLTWVQPGESGGRPFERFELAEPDRPSVAVSETSAGGSADRGCGDRRQADAESCSEGYGDVDPPASADAAVLLADITDAPELPRDLEDRAASEHGEPAQLLEPGVPPGELFADEDSHDYDGH
jgi:hypothetical protein